MKIRYTCATCGFAIVKAIEKPQPKMHCANKMRLTFEPETQEDWEKIEQIEPILSQIGFALAGLTMEQEKE